MELPWFHGLDDAALEAALRSLEGSEADANAAVAVGDAPPFAWLLHKTESDVTVSVNPQAPLQVQLRFTSGESDHTSTDTSSNSSRDTNPATSTTRGRRKRHEMQSLKEQVQVLESTVSELSHGQAHGRCQMNKAMDRAWESMALRQRSQLRRSQAENRKLRRTVEEYDHVVDRLQRLIQLNEERVRTGSLVGMHPTRLLSNTGVSDQDTAMLESLTEVLTPMYHRTEAVLSDPRLTKFSPCFYDINVERGPDSLAIQRIDSRTVPFIFEKTSDAVWSNLLHRLGSERRSQAPPEELPNQTRRAHFISHMRVAGFDGYVTCYMALRRIVEPTRVTLLRSAVFIYMDDAVPDTPVVKVVLDEEAGNSEVKRVVLRSSPVRHFLWMTVTRPQHHIQPHAASDPTQLTQIQTTSISLPNVAGQNESEIAVTTKFYSEISRQMHLQSEEEVDNLLLGSTASDQVVHHGTRTVASC